MKFSDLNESDFYKIRELAPAPAPVVAPGAQPAGSAPQPGVATQQDPQAAAKAQALAVVQAKERKDNIQKQLKGIDEQIKSLTQQKADLQKELSTIR